MTAAFGELTGPALRGRAGRFLCVLALVLPVPLCAVLGLSLPLPATVERLAAELVPFAQQGSASIGVDGSIVLANGEGRPSDDGAKPRGPQATIPAAGTGAEAGKTRTVDAGAQVAPGTRPNIKTGEEESSGSTGGKGTVGSETGPSAPAPAVSTPTPTTSTQTTSTQTPSPGTSEPSSPTQVVETTVNTVNTAVESATETAVGATESASETAKETVATATETAAGAVGGKLP